MMENDVFEIVRKQEVFHIIYVKDAYRISLTVKRLLMPLTFLF